MLSSIAPREHTAKAVRNAHHRTLCLSSLACLYPVISHRIRNPLASIQNVAEILISELDQPGHIHDLEAILEEVARLRQLTERLALISRPLINRHEPIDVAPLARQALTDVSQRATLLAIDLKYLGTAEVWAPIDPDLLQLLLATLLDNAIEACQRGDAISVTIEQNEDALLIRVRDSGLGMSQRTLERATEAFFTTKDASAGMGLTLTREVVERVAGGLTLWSSPDGGTEVALHLPV